MRLGTLIGRELMARPGPMITCGIIILLGVAAVVGIQHLTTFSEMAVARELDALGANVFILPKGVSVQDYYAADLHDQVLPEEYITRLALSSVQGVDNLSPKLCVPVDLAGIKVTLTGILPKNEFQAKAAWSGIGIFSRPKGCGADAIIPGQPTQADLKALGRKRIIDNLGADEALVGADVASRAGLKEGDKVTVLDKTFSVIAVLPATGTVDDSRLFAHLHTVQDLTKKGPVVNAIEVVGCCKQIAKGLVEDIMAVLPDTKVVTITQIVQTQQTVNNLMARLAVGLLVILVIVGAISMGSAMFANVNERRKEIGTLMALGATPGLTLRLFLGKAIILGLVGGILGTFLGTFLAVYFGPQLVAAVVEPMPWLMGTAIGLAVVIAVIGTIWPALRAARLDPCYCLREI